MAYNKPFAVCQNFPVGIQSVNRLIDNNQALYDLWTKKHGTRDDGRPSLTPFDYATSFGVHNDILIARQVLHFEVKTWLDGTKYLNETTASRVINYVTRLGTGYWRISFSAYGLYAAVGAAYATSVVDRKVMVRTIPGQLPPAGTSGYAEVSTWNVATPARLDFDFSLVVWSEVQIPWTL